ncbi:MAG: hypothetical protein J6O55_06180, partial [Lachnospiraceae bacterium]|nr:hypothetical protein [Lachnospiraceae bacterium]
MDDSIVRSAVKWHGSMKGRMLSALLTVALVMGLMPASAFGEEITGTGDIPEISIEESGEIKGGSFTGEFKVGGNTVTKVKQKDRISLTASDFSPVLSSLENISGDKIYLQLIKKDARIPDPEYGGDYDFYDKYEIPLQGSMDSEKTTITFNNFDIYDSILRDASGIPVPAGEYMVRILVTYQPSTHSVSLGQYYWGSSNLTVEWSDSEGPDMITKELEEGCWGAYYSMQLQAAPKTSGHHVDWSIIAKNGSFGSAELKSRYGLAMSSGGLLYGSIPSGSGTDYAYICIRATERETGKSTECFMPIRIKSEGKLEFKQTSLPFAP